MIKLQQQKRKINDEILLIWRSSQTSPRKCRRLASQQKNYNKTPSVCSWKKHTALKISRKPFEALSNVISIY